MRKRFGQHFLIDKRVLEQIVAAISPYPEDKIVEIGPGKGALTQYILPKVNQLDAIEIDRDLVAFLEKHFATAKLTLFQGDVLQFDWQVLLNKDTVLRIVGNLPYEITTPLLFRLFALGSQIKDMHFLLQKEVVERLTAPVDSSNYSRLSVMAQYHAELTALFDVSAEAFYPPPRIRSEFIRIVPYSTPPYLAQDFNIFSQVVKEAFSYRRKTLANSLRKILPAESLASLDIDPKLRPQQITVENFVKISNMLAKVQLKAVKPY